MKMRRFLPLAVLALAACNQQSEPAPTASESASATAPEAKPGIALAEGKLVLPAVAGNPAGAYFTIANNGDKPVTIAAVTIDGAAKAEIHETVGGKMNAVDQFEIAPGGVATFARGGLHVMAFQLDARLQPGGTAEMTLTFADGDKVSAPLAIEAAGSAGMGAGMGAGMDHGSGH